MRKNRKSKARTARGPAIEALETRQLLAAIDVGISTLLPLITDDTTPSLTGTVSENTADVQVTIKQGASTIGAWDAVENGAGGWSFTLPDPDALADGTYDLLVAATANEGADSGEVSELAALTVDSTAPIADMNDVVTKLVSPALAGTVDDPAATVTLTVNGADYAAVNNGDGTWSIDAGEIAALAEGVYPVAIASIDALGNDSTAQAQITIDLTVPVVAMADLTTNTVSPSLAGDIDDPNANVMVTVNGVDYVAVNNGDGGWSLAAGQVANLADGSYAVTVTATDAAGNEATDDAQLTIDATAPAVTAPDVDTTVSSPALAGAVDDPGATITVTVDQEDYLAVNNGDGTWSIAAGQITELDDGEYVLTVVAVDALGNQATAEGTLVIDTTVPTITVTAVSPTSASPSILGTVQDPDATIVVTVNGVDYNAINNGDGSWMLPAGVIVGLAAAEWPAAITATDWIGNEASAQANLVIDAAAPLVTVGRTETTFTSPALSGTIDDPLAGITITVNSVNHAAVNNGDGTWSVAAGVLANLADGIHIVTVVAQRDAAIATVYGQIVVDATAPAITFASVARKITSPGLSGAVNDPGATVVVTVDGADYPAVNNGQGAWSLAEGQIAALAEGTYTVTVTATDWLGNHTAAQGQLTIDTTAPQVGMLDLDTNSTSPGLSGTIDEIAASVSVTVNGKTYNAVNQGNGTWTLAAGQIETLPQGDHVVTITAIDAAGNQTTDQAQLLVDTTAPIPSLDGLRTNVASPALGGNINDSTASISVNVDGADYAAVNLGDGTWSLAAGQIADLADGTYTVAVTAVDPLDNERTIYAQLIIDTTIPTITATSRQVNVASPALSGTVNDSSAQVVITVNGVEYDAVNDGSGTWTLAAGQIAALPSGTYAVTATATDLAGNVGVTAEAGELIVDLSAPVLTTPFSLATSGQPALSGDVNDPDADITVTVHGADYPATNNGDGTWSVAEGVIAQLPDGLHRFSVTAIDPAGNETTGDGGLLLVDTTGPIVTFNAIIATATRPALGGTIDDNTATVVVTVNGVDYPAVNNGDGTWSLAADTVAALTGGAHDVVVTATDTMGNVGTHAGVDAIRVADTATITLGAGIGSISYVQADGARVTLSAGKGNVQVVLTGVNVTIIGSGKSRTLLADGGILKVAINVTTATKSLTIKATGGDDGLATIDAITGPAVLSKLAGVNSRIAGDGINMVGYIRSIKVHSIEAGVIMGAAPKGISIVADIVRDSDIQTANIRSISVAGSYVNANIDANNIGVATLANVGTRNGGVQFGLTADTLGRCTVKQGRTKLVWGRDFAEGMLDFIVNV